MAKDSLGTIIGLGVAGVAGYWLYNNFFSAASAPASTSSTGTVATGTSSTATNPAAVIPGPDPSTGYPPYMASLPALSSQLQTMTGGGSAQDVDQWVFQYNRLRAARGMSPLTADQIIAILNVNPATKATRSTPIAASEFSNDIFGLGYGLAGARRWRGMGAARGFNPVMVLPYRTPQLGYRRTA